MANSAASGTTQTEQQRIDNRIKFLNLTYITIFIFHFHTPPSQPLAERTPFPLSPGYIWINNKQLPLQIPV